MLRAQSTTVDYIWAKFKPWTWSIIHTSNKTKRLTHISTKDDKKEKKRVQHCMETGNKCQFCIPAKRKQYSNKYNIQHTLHRSKVKTTLNALHQSKLVDAWKAFLLNVFKWIEYLRRRGKLFYAKQPEKERLVFKI